MRPPDPTARLAGAILPFVLCAGLSAQVTLVHQPLTEWVHTPAGSWTDDKAEATAEFDIVDQLNSATQFSFDNSYNLQAGIHTVVFRLRKITSTVGREPIHIEVTAAGNTRRMTLDSFDQVPDTWVTTPVFWFQVPAPDTRVRISVFNADTSASKQNYQFDSVRLTLMTHVEHLRHQQMTKWNHAHGSPYWVDNVADPEADFGVVDWLLNVWWLDYSRSMVMQPGDYTIHFRLKKVGNSGGPATFDYSAIPGGANYRYDDWVGHPVDTYVTSPELRFTVVFPDTDVSFWLRDVDTGMSKSNYYFDTARIDYADFRPFGKACEGSEGPPVLLGDLPPNVNKAFRVRVHNVGSAPAVAVTLGISDTVWNGLPLPIDLGVIGMTGCQLYTDVRVTGPAQILGDGTAVWGFPIPNDTNLVDREFFTQALILSPAANPLGVIVSNGGRAIIRP